MPRTDGTTGSAPEPLVEPAAVSEFLGGIPEQTLANWRSRGKGPKFHKVGKHIRYRLSEVAAWLDEQQAQQAEACRA